MKRQPSFREPYTRFCPRTSSSSNSRRSNDCHQAYYFRPTDANGEVVKAVLA